jgi:hypothetical protein
MQPPPPAAPLQLSAAQRLALRDNLGAAIYAATTAAKAEADAWRARALAAEADAARLREGLLADLALERAPADLPAALHAVAAACRPLPSPNDAASTAVALASQEECHARFLRQGACAARRARSCAWLLPFFEAEAWRVRVLRRAQRASCRRCESSAAALAPPPRWLRAPPRARRRACCRKTWRRSWWSC